MPGMFDGLRRNLKFSVGFTVVSLLFWLLQFVYQHYVLVTGSLEVSFVRSFAFAGATFLGAALFTSALFRWVPRWNRHLMVRRNLGVLGFTFIILHVFFVLSLNWNLDVMLLFTPLNPLDNPVMFGVLAFPILFAMWVTSTDWAVAKMGFKKWKFLHRLVYLAYLFSVLHFITINPPALMNLAGYALLGMTFLALSGELFWFVRTRMNLGFRGVGSLVGVLFIFVWLLVIYFALVPFLSA